MPWRRTELSAFAPEISWLGNSDSKELYRRASECLDRPPFRLDPRQFHPLERLTAARRDEHATEWLSSRIGCGEFPLYIVFDSDTVCVVRSSFFVERWRELFGSRPEDVIVVPQAGSWTLAYWKQDFEFEFGVKGVIATRD